MRLNRVVEERLVNLYRQGKVVGGLYRSLGQEATSVGSAYALSKGDVVGPLIRNLGVVLVMGYSPRDVMTQYMARATSPSGGKDCNLHFGHPDRGVISPISMLGALVPVMAGIALAGRMQKKNIVTMTWIGDGGTSTGAFHEGINFAAVQQLPMVVIVENNGWAYSTPFRKQTAARCLADKGGGLRHPGRAGRRQRRPRRLRGGAARRRPRARGRRPDSGRVDDVPDEGPRRARRAGVRPEAGARGVAREGPDPTLLEGSPRDGVAQASDLEAIDRAISEEVDREVDAAEKAPLPTPDAALRGVYADEASDAEPVVVKRNS
jgi:pyruvate dehydrogenase E1 component alpha subunit/2-oxoisovalerate dehydrogenase E1 component alpha subunit